MLFGSCNRETEEASEKQDETSSAACVAALFLCHNVLFLSQTLYPRCIDPVHLPAR